MCAHGSEEGIWAPQRGSDPASACATAAHKCRLCGKDCKSALMPANNTADKTKYAGQVCDPVLKLRRAFVLHNQCFICHILHNILSTSLQINQGSGPI